MSGGSILEAVEKLEAGTVSKRSAGVDDLERLLTSPHSTLKLDKVGDLGWQKVLNVLYGLIKNDKSDVLGGSASAKKRAANRLGAISKALRLVVSSCSDLIRPKTAFGVLDHISNLLTPSQRNDEDFRQPVELEYVRAFRVLLLNEVHAEHIRPKDWERYISFVLRAISDHLGNSDLSDDDGESSAKLTSFGTSMRSTFAHHTSQASNSEENRRKIQLLNDLVECLRSLTSITNCPLQNKLEDIAHIVLETLQSSVQAKDAAFACLNNIILVALTESTELAANIADSILTPIRKYWSDLSDQRPTNLREQMLTSLLLLRQYLFKPLTSSSSVDPRRLDSLAISLVNRTSYESLSVSDLVFSNCDDDSFFSRRGIAPNLDSPAAILNWTAVSIVAVLRTITSGRGKSQDPGDAQDEVPRKRQKTSTPLPDLVRLLVIDEDFLTTQDVQEAMRKGVPTLTDDREGRSSWFLLILARLCRTSVGQSRDLGTLWIEAWSGASRLLTSSSNSRVACFAMMAMLESGVVDTYILSSGLLNFCFQGGTRGPNNLSDGALLLFSAALRSNLISTDRQLEEFRDKVMSWLDGLWQLPETQDHANSVEVASMARPALLHDLLLALTLTSFDKYQIAANPTTSVIYQTYMQQLENEQFASFLVEPGVICDHIKTSHSGSTTIQATSLHKSRILSLVSSYLSNKLQSFVDAFQNMRSLETKAQSNGMMEAGRRVAVSIETIEIICTACTVSVTICDASDDCQLQNAIRRGWQCVTDYMRLQNGTTTLFETTFSRLTANFLTTRPTDTWQAGGAKLRSELAQQLRITAPRSGSSQALEEDADSEFWNTNGTSQQSHIKSHRSSQGTTRRANSQVTDDHSMFIHSRALLLEESMRYDLSNRGAFAVSVVDFLVAVSPDELVSLRHDVVEWLERYAFLAEVDAHRLLRRIGEVCLEDPKNDRNEAALCFCLNVLKNTMPIWITTQHEGLAGIVLDMYSWYIDAALGSGIASTRVLYDLSLLLESLLENNSQYGADGQKPLQSPRTSLLQMLKFGRSSLRFRIVPSLTRLFDGYVLTEHAKLFDDIVNCLPTNADDTEGIAVRLYILAKLGSTWRTVLRQAAYHIFETAANVPSSVSFAHNSLRLISAELNLGGHSSTILQFFGPQIFYTWLEESSIDTIPFAAFGYDNLQQLLLAEQEELVAHTALRCSSRNASIIENATALSWTDLLEVAFPRLQAYVVTADIVEHKVGADFGPLENAIVEQLGKAKYLLLSQRSFAEAVENVFITLSDDRNFDKVLRGSNHDKNASRIYETIYLRGSSTIVYPARQQPSFRAKYLLQILSKLSLRSDLDPALLWSPALLVGVCRRLFDDADSALGPLHVASAIRKIRIVVALAENVALKGYPLKMLLHNLRPFLTNFHCAEDTIGIYWYLLESSVTYLGEDLSFIAGLSVAIFASLSVFITSSQESTTQESQFVSTMTKAKEFRHWLGEYLSEFETHALRPEQKERFLGVVQNAKQITKAGTNITHEPEGSLLRHVLIDQASDEPLIPETFFHSIIWALSREFHYSPEPSEDILATDSSCISVSPVLCQVLEKVAVPESFRTWIGSVLGRAYTLQGPNLSLKPRVNTMTPKNNDATAFEPIQSYQKIIRVLKERLWSPDAKAASVSERTLSQVLGKLSSKERHAMLHTREADGSLEDLVFEGYPAPRIIVNANTKPHSKFDNLQDLESFNNAHDWAAALAEVLIGKNKQGEFIFDLIPIVRAQGIMAASMLPMVVHVVLNDEVEKREHVAQNALASLFNTILSREVPQYRSFSLVVLDIILYLRRCKYPGETTEAKRNSWLDIDYGKAASAALHCGMAHTALLMLETEYSEQNLQASRSRRSSAKVIEVNQQLLTKIFQSVSDPDFFYGAHLDDSLEAISTKLQHEYQGQKLLAVQSALLDSRIRLVGSSALYKHPDSSIVSALAMANMDGLAFATQQQTGTMSVGQSSATLHNSLLNINQWDVSSAGAGKIYDDRLGMVFQKLEAGLDRKSISSVLEIEIARATSRLFVKDFSSLKSTKDLQNLAVLADLQKLVSAKSAAGMQEAWHTVIEEHDCLDECTKLSASREAVAAAMKRNGRARELFHLTPANALLSEINAVRASLSIAAKHDATQFSLNRAVYLLELQKQARELGLSVDGPITMNVSSVLWSQGEISGPIQMLSLLLDSKILNSGDIPLSRAELLTDLGQKISQARLDRADEVTEKYLRPAINALKDTTVGSMAGRVYHNFAAFCDEQLQDSSAKDDFDRMYKLRNRKLQEVNDLADLVRKASGRERDILKSHFSKAKTWFKLDDEEYKRLKHNRQKLLQNCLENYLLSMGACDDFGKDVLRFLSLWLSNSDAPEPNESVGKHLPSVPTLKMAPFVNQLSSRLTDGDDKFSTSLFELLFRIASDHPYHSHYQLFAVSKTKGAHNDPVAESRHEAARKLTSNIHHSAGISSAIWVAIHNSNLAFSHFAQEKQDKEMKSGTKIPIRNFKTGRKLEQTVQGITHKIPPPTMHIELRADKDYTLVPTFSAFEPQVSIAGGVSAPKIVAVVATDGSRHKMLLKGGNDDLRQDAIMEQVFAQVSNLLQDHRPTRQRNLGIRTYKVIPLTHNSGIIEFVQNTLPLHDYLLPAHTRYFPKDYKSNTCRKMISEAQSRKVEDRVRTYQNVTQNFHPVMRFFFMERFLDPDQWFEKRLNYSRSTAAISMLGHVLGVGDRHGHNILLDEQTGEVVHIDLGVAFESGRVLPVPEVVPFRLTRDIIDGMGMSGVEGPFRRCCNFTLEALRKNQDAIMTILDVLRWDPLHSWSVSPLRVARMQEQQNQEAAANTSVKDENSTPGPEDGNEPEAKKTIVPKMQNIENEPGEADRALAVVAKKLSASLSVEATVNELIRQATDERNLAVLYCGWAAYA